MAWFLTSLSRSTESFTYFLQWAGEQCSHFNTVLSSSHAALPRFDHVDEELYQSEYKRSTTWCLSMHIELLLCKITHNIYIYIHTPLLVSCVFGARSGSPGIIWRDWRSLPEKLTFFLTTRLIKTYLFRTVYEHSRKLKYGNCNGTHCYCTQFVCIVRI